MPLEERSIRHEVDEDVWLTWCATLRPIKIDANHDVQGLIPIVQRLQETSRFLRIYQRGSGVD